MDLDGALSFITLLLHWRVLVSTLCAAALSIALAFVFPWFTALQGISLTCVSCGAGILWHSTVWQSSMKLAATSTEPTAASTYAIAASLFGLFWGGASSSSPHAIFAGILLLPFFAWAWLRYAAKQRQLHQTGYPFLCVIAAVLAYSVAALIGVNAA